MSQWETQAQYCLKGSECAHHPSTSLVENQPVEFCHLQLPLRHSEAVLWLSQTWKGEALIT
jgi:hypothetical protein